MVCLASRIIKDQCKQDSAAVEISQILDEVDDDYMEVPEQDSEEIGFQPGKFNDSEVLMCGKGRNNVEETAIQLLATRAYTAVELRKKLHSKHFPPGIVKTLTNDFQERGLINDSLYAEVFSRSRWSSSCWGPVRIKHARRACFCLQVSSKILRAAFLDKANHDLCLLAFRAFVFICSHHFLLKRIFSVPSSTREEEFFSIELGTARTTADFTCKIPSTYLKLRYSL